MRRAVIVCILAGVVLFSTIGAHAFFGLFGSSPEKVSAREGQITLDDTALDKGQVKHYRYQEKEMAVRFFLVRDNQGVLRVALDACEVCWHEGRGYISEDGVMVCRHCGMQFQLSRIGLVRGGCNPHPVVFNTSGDTVTIASQELMEGARYFPDNKLEKR